MSILIIGSGFAGLGMAIRLKGAGIHDFTILERGDAIGGTWRDNHYPGCACDVESNLYSFSFEQNPGWSRTFAPQKEIRAYLEHCAEKYGVLPHVKLNQNVKEARYDEASQSWQLETTGGETHRGQVLIAAIGGLSNPAFPSLPGIEKFQGKTFHSATWDHSYDLKGKRVAVIGTGASAIQFVPQIAPEVAQLHLFQRTPPWIMEKADRPVTGVERFLFKHLPFTQRLARRRIYWRNEARVLALSMNPKVMELAKISALNYLKRTVKDKALRKKLTPDYAMGCKRILLTNDYYPALTRPNVDVVTEGVKEVRERSIVASDGTEREVDAIIYGTGFTAQSPVPRGAFIGRGGADLVDVWDGAPEAFKGANVKSFPNLFFICGPNTGLGHTSMIYMIESHVQYALDAIQKMRAGGWASVEVKAERQAEFNDALQKKLEGTVWQTGGCRSWYQNAEGRNTALWPDFTFRFRKQTARFEPSDYVIESEREEAQREAAE